MTSVDEFDDSTEVCFECDEEILPEAARYEDDVAFCYECYDGIFGEG